MSDEVWTSELTAAVILEWNDKKSANQIAAAHGLTRNQITGKLNRLRADGVELRAPGAPASLKRADRGKGKLRALVAETASAGAAPNVVNIVGLGKVRSGANAPLTGDGCLFIEGDPVADLRQGIDPHCGDKRQSGSSYCEAHHARCWIKPKKRAQAA